MVEESRAMFMDIPSAESRSLSPMTPSPGRDRSAGILDMLTRRMGRLTHDDICFENHDDEDSRSSSPDSNLSDRLSPKNRHNSNLELSYSSDASSNNSADTSNTETRSRRRSLSSLRKAFQRISLSSRSLSCTNAAESSKKKKLKKK